MKNFIRYNGEHIYLSPIRADDEAVELYTKWVNDESINGWIGKSNCVYTLESEQQWAQKNNKIYFNIILKSDYTPDGLEKLIGNSENNRAFRCYLKAGFKECGRAHEELYFHGHYADRIYMEILEQNYFGKGKSL